MGPFHAAAGIGQVDKPGSSVIGTPMAAAIARNISVAVVFSTRNETCAGREALVSLGKGVTFKTAECVAVA